MSKLTKRVVERIKPDADGDVTVWDDEIAGFGIRVWPSHSARGRNSVCARMPRRSSAVGPSPDVVQPRVRVRKSPYTDSCTAT
jgi:hypothetical protein